MNASYKKYIAECLGTFALVLFGCGTAAAVGCSSEQGSGYLVTALAFGLILMAMIYAIGPVSGCHVNPAVSLALFMKKKLSLNDLVGYIVAQCIGAIVGAIGVMYLLGKESGLGANALYEGSVVKSIVVEVVLTFFFILVILQTTAKASNGAVAGLVIGLTLTVIHILGIAFTGTSVNPARSLGPALLAGGSALSSVWVFIVGPLIGGALAALLSDYLEKK